MELPLSQDYQPMSNLKNDRNTVDFFEKLESFKNSPDGQRTTQRLQSIVSIAIKNQAEIFERSPVKGAEEKNFFHYAAYLKGNEKEIRHLLTEVAGDVNRNTRKAITQPLAPLEEKTVKVRPITHALNKENLPVAQWIADKMFEICERREEIYKRERFFQHFKRIEQDIKDSSKMTLANKQKDPVYGEEWRRNYIKQTDECIKQAKKFTYQALYRLVQSANESNMAETLKFLKDSDSICAFKSDKHIIEILENWIFDPRKGFKLPETFIREIDENTFIRLDEDYYILSRVAKKISNSVHLKFFKQILEKIPQRINRDIFFRIFEMENLEYLVKALEHIMNHNKNVSSYMNYQEEKNTFLITTLKIMQKKFEELSTTPANYEEKSNQKLYDRTMIRNHLRKTLEGLYYILNNAEDLDGIFLSDKNKSSFMDELLRVFKPLYDLGWPIHYDLYSRIFEISLDYFPRPQLHKEHEPLELICSRYEKFKKMNTDYKELEKNYQKLLLQLNQKNTPAVQSEKAPTTPNLFQKTPSSGQNPAGSNNSKLQTDAEKKSGTATGNRYALDVISSQIKKDLVEKRTSNTSPERTEKAHSDSTLLKRTSTPLKKNSSLEVEKQRNTPSKKSKTESESPQQDETDFDLTTGQKKSAPNLKQTESQAKLSEGESVLTKKAKLEKSRKYEKMTLGEYLESKKKETPSKKSKNQSKTPRDTRTISKRKELEPEEKNSIGRNAEKFVYDWLMNHYEEKYSKKGTGSEDQERVPTVEVIWHNQDLQPDEDYLMDHDILIKKDGKERKFIEVKGTRSSAPSLLTITKGELALMQLKKKEYTLIRVYDVNGNPFLKKFTNLHEKFDPQLVSIIEELRLVL